MPWDYWCRNIAPYSNTTWTTSSQTYTIGTWEQWNTTTTTWQVPDTWGVWNTTYISTGGNIVYNLAPVLSDEERAQLAERADQRQREADARRRELEAAAERAEALLVAHLDPSQAAEYNEHRHFHVTTRSGRRYRIACGRAHNVHRIVGDRPTVEYCAHVRDLVPDHDNVLAQKLMLEHDEDAFLAIANSRPLVRNQ